MILVYVAGAYRGNSAWAIHRNIRRAEKAAVEVNELNVAGEPPALFAVCPHKLGEHMDGLFDDDFWIASTLEVMRRCDVVYVYHPFHLEISEGTRGEVAEARRLGKRILFGPEALHDFAKEVIK